MIRAARPLGAAGGPQGCCGGLRVTVQMEFSREGWNVSVCFGQGGVKVLAVTAGGVLCGCNQESWAGLYKRCLNEENLFGFRCGPGEN